MKGIFEKRFPNSGIPRHGLLSGVRRIVSSMSAPAYLARYDAMCDKAAAQVIAKYSTSFSMATKVLDRQVRRDIRNIYAMVRIADEIVDGTTAQAHEDPETCLDAYEEQVLHAPSHRFHTDPVLHAFAQTYRRCGLKQEHVRAFFDSMRRDLTQTEYAGEDLDTYIYGSAEVIGLMCLDVFLRGHETTPADREAMEQGAKALGSAFQKINFLRDYVEDEGLGRRYVDKRRRAELIAEIRAELDRAKETIGLLPRSARAGVAAAEALFRELTDRLEDPTRERVSVPNSVKVKLTARAVWEGLK